MHSEIHTVGLIGSGLVGSTIARLAVDAGFHVVLSNSREPATLSALVQSLGKSARAATPAEAAAAGDVVVVTVPLRAYASVPVSPLIGKVVIDTNNYYPDRDGRILALDRGTATVSGLLQQHLPNSRVVKAFNNIYYKHLQALARPSGAPDRSALPMAGNDDAARHTVSALLDALGFDAVDAGALSEGWRFERDMPAYAVPYFRKGPSLGIPHGASASAPTIIAALKAAHVPTAA